MANKVSATPAQPPISEDQAAPEFFVSHLLRCDMDVGAVVKLTFTSNRFDEATQQGLQKVVLRLAIPAVALEGAAAFIAQWIERSKAAAAPMPPNVHKH
jgi:hypothetical protein